MTSTSSRPVARLSTPGDIAATIPTLCGFLPERSVVVLSLRGRRRRLGLTVRLDLPDPAGEASVAELLADRMAQDGAAAAVVAVFAPDARGELVARVRAACERRGIGVMEALHVHDGRWTSYLCTGACCPASGSPVPQVPPLVEAERTLDGRVVLPSREALVRSLAPPALLLAQRCAQACERATVTWLQQCRDQGAAGARRQALRDAAAALNAVADGAGLEVEAAAALAASLHDVLVRDEIATWELTRSDELLSLLEQACRLTPPPFDAPVCTLLAWVAYARGDGSRANVGLDRALQTDPSYSLALLLRSALDGALPPRDVRELLRQTAAVLAAGTSSPGSPSSC